MQCSKTTFLFDHLIAAQAVNRAFLGEHDVGLAWAHDR
jgi:hypothetical protein